MESKELMIGNWVKRPRSLDDRVIIPSIVDKVSGISTFGSIEFYRDPTVIGFDCPAKYLVGIEITPEILEMAGFVENKEFELLPTVREFLLPIKCRHSKYAAIRCWVNGDRSFAAYIINHEYASENVSYLHQLQNLYFALTSTHLKIELK